MNEPWFDPNLYSWIPGTVFGTTAGILGGVVGTLAPQGKGRPIVLGAWIFFLGTSLSMLVAGIVAYFSGQPYGIWYGLGLPGLIGSILFTVMLPVVMLRFREAEERRMRAADMAT